MKLKPSIKNITVYGAPWCGDCVRAYMFFNEFEIEVENINIDEDEVAEARVYKLNKGIRPIPTIVIDYNDGKQKIITEPSRAELVETFLD